MLKLPVRPPVLVAKQASSLAFLSGNRLGLGVGLSPWPEDFDALGVPWERRGKRMDECMDILRGLTQPGRSRRSSATRASSTSSSRSSSARRRPRRSRCSSAATPTPRCGAPYARATAGCTPAATARSSTGCWSGSPRSGKEEGDTRDDFEVHVISYDAYTTDGVKRLEDKGVTDCIVGFRVPYIKGPDTEPLETKIKHLEQYAENIIAKVSAVTGRARRTASPRSCPTRSRRPRS